MPTFKKAYKKLHKNQQEIVNESISAIIADPLMGEEKKGDLSGVYVHQFKMHKQEMLLAYEWDPSTRMLLALGVHENFYRDLKR